MSERQKIGRLAFREEGRMWNAYYALPETMKDAIPIGSLTMTASPARKRAFLLLMRDIMGDLIEGKTGVRPTFGIQPAPESERGGNA